MQTELKASLAFAAAVGGFAFAAFADSAPRNETYDQADENVVASQLEGRYAILSEERNGTSIPKEAESVGMIRKVADSVTLLFALPRADAPPKFKTNAHQQLLGMKKLPIKPSEK